MKEILIFGSCEALDMDLMHAMGEKFRLVPVQNNTKEYLKKDAAMGAAVVWANTPSDLDGFDPTLPFIVIAGNADDRMIRRAVECGAKYVFFSPVPAEMFFTRLEDLFRAA